jgi:hypothetical protein
VSGGSLRPGLPPRPPANLGQRELTLREIPARTVLYRIHRTNVGALYYGPRTDPEERGRWDAPDDCFGVCYLAERGHTAFAETLLRELDREELSEKGDLRPSSLARIRVQRPLVLARMHGSGPRRVKATAAVVHGPYEITWAWSKAIQAHPSQVDGIGYRARHDDDDLSIALFDRAADAIVVTDSLPLLDPALAAELGSWLDLYGIGLVP